jgi:hypothetical protein
VWILDHLWTTSLAQGAAQLQQIDGLVDRLWTLMDMDRRLAEKRAEAAAGAASGTGAPAATVAGADAPLVDVDESILSAIMSEASVSRERALESYQSNRGDLIASIISLGGQSEQEIQTQAAMEQIVASQVPAQEEAPAAVAPLTHEERVALVWSGLFEYGFVGSYFTTLQNDVSSSTLAAENVQTTIYVNDEFGSAVGQANDTANANAKMEPLVCVTLGGVGFSLMWLTKDLEEGDEVLITRRPAIRLAGVPFVRKF